MTRNHSIRCYNCGATGHLSKECKQEQKRVKGSCFRCGSLEHRIKDCSRSQPRTENTTNVIQTLPLIDPYLISLSYQIAVDSDNNSKYSLEAMIDSGSPISLIKNNCPCSCLYPDFEKSIFLRYSQYRTRDFRNL